MFARFVGFMDFVDETDAQRLGCVDEVGAVEEAFGSRRPQQSDEGLGCRGWVDDAELGWRDAESRGGIADAEITSGSDLHAASDAGMRTAFVPRPHEWGSDASAEPYTPGEFNIVAEDFEDLAGQLNSF